MTSSLWREPHSVLVEITRLNEPRRWRCVKCGRVWVYDPVQGIDDLAHPVTGSASACSVQSVRP